MLQCAWNPETGFLPQSLGARLLMGSVGSRHLMALAMDALRPSTENGPSQGALNATATHLLLAAWEDEPLHGALAAQASTLLAQGQDGDPVLPVLDALVAAWNEPRDMRYFERLAENMEFDKLHRFLESKGEAEPNNLFWLQQTWAVAEVDGDLDQLAERMERHWPAGAALAPLRAFLLGNLAFLRNDVARAEALYAEAALEGSAWLKPLERRAECLHRLGRTEEARALWAKVLAEKPWHASLALHVHDLLLKRDQAVADLDGRTAALLYTWNKAADLNRVLESVAQSSGWDLLVALDNGSTDQTPEVLAAWLDKLGADRMRVTRLPVNVGAPAARNWLKSLPEVRECAFAAYIDDDAILPPNWVGRLGAAREAYPDAGVWGCRILDAAAPFTIQCADQHITVGGEFQPDQTDPAAQLQQNMALNQLHATPFLLSALPSLTPGYGLFEYVRPCAAVTGCCHLFAMHDLAEGPDFSISLSPSQYDDLERDLRQALAGRIACYQGFLAVHHLKRSGKAVRGAPEQLGSGLANRYKMYRLFTPEDVWAITAFSREQTRRDFLSKLPVLERELGLTSAA